MSLANSQILKLQILQFDIWTIHTSIQEKQHSEIIVRPVTVMFERQHAHKMYFSHNWSLIYSYSGHEEVCWRIGFLGGGSTGRALHIGYYTRESVEEDTVPPKQRYVSTHPARGTIFSSKLSGQNIGLQKVVDRLFETRPQVGHAEDLKQIRNIKHFTWMQWKSTRTHAPFRPIQFLPEKR